jgi:hypothetical protein
MDLRRREKGAKFKDKWWVLVNAVLKFGFYKMWKLCRLPEKLVYSHERLCSIELVDLVG